MIDRQVHINPWNRDESHITGTVHIQLTFIVVYVLIRHSPWVRVCSQSPVVIQGVFPYGNIFVIGQFGYALRISYNGPALVHAVPVITECRITRNGYAGKQNQHQDQVRYPVFLFLPFSAIRSSSSLLHDPVYFLTC